MLYFFYGYFIRETNYFLFIFLIQEKNLFVKHESVLLGRVAQYFFDFKSTRYNVKIYLTYLAVNCELICLIFCFVFKPAMRKIDAFILYLFICDLDWLVLASKCCFANGFALPEWG